MTNDANNALLERDAEHLIHPLHSRAGHHDGKVWVRGEGAVLIDANGDHYLDGLAGLWNNTAGNGRQELADAAAKQIGWPPGSPFQFEVGLHDGAWGVLGFLSIWIGGLFWLATGLGWSLFMLGACYGHIVQTVHEGNYAPYNFLTIFSDGFVGVWLLVLLYLYWRLGGFETQTS